MYLIKLAKTIGIMFIIILVSTLLVTILHYIGLSKSIVTILKILIVVCTLFYGGFYIAKKSDNKGYLEGIKLGIIVVILFFLITWLGTNVSINFKSVIFYVLIITSSMLGGMIGINKKKLDDENS